TPTFHSAAQRFLERQSTRLRPRTLLEVKRHLLAHARPLEHLPLAKIDRRAIAARLSKIEATSGPVARNRTRSSLSAFFAWCVREGLIDLNPVAGTGKAHEGPSRSRVLADHELRAIWNALEDNDHFSDIVRLLTLTGQRRDEISALRWSEVDADRGLITLPAERTKNRHEHQIPLSAPALAILKAQPRRMNGGSPRDFVFGLGEGGFSGWSGGKELLDARIEKAGFALEHWTLHDLRRTAATRMIELGVLPHVVEAVLNHTLSGHPVLNLTGHRSGVAQVYNRAAYSAEKAAALTLWASALLKIVGGRHVG